MAELGAAFLCADLGLTAGLAVSPSVASCSPVAPVAALEWHAGRSNAPDAHRWSPPQPPSVDEGDFFWGGGDANAVGRMPGRRSSCVSVRPPIPTLPARKGLIATLRPPRRGRGSPSGRIGFEGQDRGFAAGLSCCSQPLNP